MPEFNIEQRAAIVAENPFLLCAAGAGSGKTTVMVESVVHKLRGNAAKDIANFLIITFTNEAAGNMKRKIQERLTKDAKEGAVYAARGLSNLENASISTIHAFCKRLISTYFYAIEGMSPKFEIIEEARLERLFQESYEASLDEIFDPEQTAWTAEEIALVRELMDAFRQTELVAVCRELYKALMGIPEPFTRLDEYIENIEKPIDENPWAQELLFSVDMDLLSLDDFLAREEEMLCALTPAKCLEAAQQDREILLALKAALAKQPPIEEKLAAILAAKDAMPTVRAKISEEAKDWNEAFKALRNEVKGSKGLLDRAAKNLQKLVSAKQWEDNARIRKLLCGISILLRACAERFRQRKLALQGIDYADMEQMAYELVKREDIREAIMASITDIYVDECQDVSAIQYAIIQALAGGEGRSLCMVGDIKQSIYGFRSAAPDLMEKNIRSYSEESEASHRKIFFQQNYRSCAQVIECVNEVFDAAMDRRVSEIDYTPEDHLKANVPGDFGPVKVILLSQEEDAEAELLESQCEAAGQQIRELVQNGGRHYRDIVILVRNTSSDAPLMVEHFRKMNIPVMYDGGQTFYGLTEISSLLSLLSVIDNEHTDVELVGALRNVPFLFTDEELAQIRKEKQDRSWFYEAFQFCCRRGETALDQKCAAAREQIRVWRELSRSMSASAFIWQLMRDSGIYATRGAYPDGRLRQLNLDSFYQRAVDMEKRGVFRLSDFLWEIGKIRDAKPKDSGDTPATLGEKDDCVRLMTMHKSKGLEFPVVILMNLQKSLRNKPSKSRIRICVSGDAESKPPLGVYVPVRSRRRHTKRDSFGADAFKSRETRNAIAEDTRLLYVAMTRAMENLILIGHFKEKDSALWQEKTKISRIWKTRSMLDLVMPAVLQHLSLPMPGQTTSGGQWQLSVQRPQAIRDKSRPLSSSQLDDRMSRVLAERVERPDGMWIAGTQDASPLKTSVTSLLRAGFAAQAEEEETVEVKRRSELPGFLLSEVAPRPAFMEVKQASAADIGTLTHRLLRLIDLAVFRGRPTEEYESVVSGELARMRSHGILSEAEAAAVYAKGVAAFFESALGQRLIAAPQLQREWPFTMLLSEQSPTMVQGIVDAAFLEDGAWVLVDYKTDRDADPARFVPRHEKQMNWYRLAVERLTGQPVKEMWLFALRAGQAYPVQRTELF